MADTSAHSSRPQTREIGTIIIGLDGTLVDSTPDLAATRFRELYDKRLPARAVANSFSEVLSLVRPTANDAGSKTCAL